MKYTSRINLSKPEYTDPADIEVINNNMDLIDNEFGDFTKITPYGGVTTNSGNNYSISSPPIAGYGEGMSVNIKVNANSTGVTTLNWNSKGAKSIKKADGNNVTNLKAGGMYTLRYNGSNFILQGEGASGNATASDLLSGKTATTDVGEIVGTMPNRGTVSTDITTKAQQVTIAAGKHSGSGIVKISATEQAKIIAGNIKSGVTLLGMAGSLQTGIPRQTAKITGGSFSYSVNSQILVNHSGRGGFLGSLNFYGGNGTAVGLKLIKITIDGVLFTLDINAVNSISRQGYDNSGYYSHCINFWGLRFENSVKIEFTYADWVYMYLNWSTDYSVSSPLYSYIPHLFASQMTYSSSLTTVHSYNGSGFLYGIQSWCQYTTDIDMELVVDGVTLSMPNLYLITRANNSSVGTFTIPLFIKFNSSFQLKSKSGYATSHYVLYSKD